MVAVLNIVLPNVVMSAGVRGKSRRFNTRTTNQGGFSEAVPNWVQSLRQYDIGFVPMRVDVWQTLFGLFEATWGGAYGFLMEDPTDSFIPLANGVMMPFAQSLVGNGGAGYGLPTYYLGKRYTSIGSAVTSDRKITRPKGTIAIYRNGSPITIGAAPGNATINADTGLVTFVADQTQAVTTVTTGASSVINFASGVGIVAAMSVGQRVYLSGLTGTGASRLNGLSHQITAKGATSLTVSTDTTGFTASGGTAGLYPQSTEPLTLSGSFYVPVQFASDEIEWEMVISGDRDARYLGSSLMLQEIRE
jgi:uncharacterized protein (TIGR02217 family)